MGHDHHTVDTTRSVQELLPRSRHGWEAFTKATLWCCLGVAVLLLMMLAFLK